MGGSLGLTTKLTRRIQRYIAFTPSQPAVARKRKLPIICAKAVKNESNQLMELGKPPRHDLQRNLSRYKEVNTFVSGTVALGYHSRQIRVVQKSSLKDPN